MEFFQHLSDVVILPGGSQYRRAAEFVHVVVFLFDI